MHHPTGRHDHAKVAGTRISVEFRGKGGKLLHAEVSDRRLARTMQRLQDLPGRELFEYLDAGTCHRRQSPPARPRPLGIRAGALPA